ncbi:MAG: isoprenylcysteine carboxylmethyltransferase family protein [Clostridiales bacterium]|nr:isoprenylcysteine carboxylmethyltransferase family protein [Clostridiales bacterium]
MKKGLLRSGIIRMIAGLVLMGAMLFLPAGTWRYPGAWRLLALLFLPMPVIGIVLAVKAPELLAKRLNVKEQESEQKQVIVLSALIFILGFVLAGLDFRFGWTQLPLAVVIAGMVLFLLAYGLYLEVMRENAYLSRTVEIQEGQKVIDTGLYGVVRHPMYMAVTILFLSMPLVLGSVIAILPFLGIPAVLVKRIKNEEQVLEAGLPGYREYEKKVAFRMIPFLW